MSDILDDTVKKEINKLNRLKKQGAITPQEYKKLLNEAMHPYSTWKQMMDFSSMSSAEKRRKILFIMLTLGMLSILAGLGLIIGANWEVIPYSLKLGGVLALLGGSLFGVLYCETHQYPNIKELFLSVAFLLIAGNMAIIQQFLQLSLTWNQGSLIWFGLSCPLLLFTKKIWLPIACGILFLFGIWDVIEWGFDSLNYMAICGVLSIVVFTSFFGGDKTRLVRRLFMILGMFVLFVGDVDTEDIGGIISNIVFLIFLVRLPRSQEGQVKFCNFLSIFIVWRIFLLFCIAYHNLMSIGIQLVVFGSILLGIAGIYYFFFDTIQGTFKRLVHHEE